MLNIQEFIQSNRNWETLLKEEPYSLSISRENGLILFSYNMLFSDPTNSIVKEARGLILEDETFKTVCVPFFRFYNHTESYCDKIDWNTARVQEKVDGSIIKMYYYNNEWRIATNGVINAFNCNLNIGRYENFGSLFVDALKATAPVNVIDDFFHNKCSILDKKNTYIFELVSPFNRVVVPYETPMVYHTGTRNIKTLEELEIDIGIQKPRSYRFSSLEECAKIASSLPFNEEGYVVVDGNWKRVKVKSPAYLAVHHLRSNDGTVSPKRAIDLIMTGEDVEFLSYYKEYEDFFKEIKGKLLNYENDLIILQKYYDDHIFSSRKDLAKWATSTMNKDFVFGYADGKYTSAAMYLQVIFKAKGAARLEEMISQEE